MTKTEYEIKDIRLTKDGLSFQVIVESDFLVDPIGQRIEESFQYPIALLEYREVWESKIDKIMVKRALEADVNEAQLTQMQRLLARMDRINAVKEQALGKKDVTDKVDMERTLKNKAKGLLGKVPAEATKGSEE